MQTRIVESERLPDVKLKDRPNGVYANRVTGTIFLKVGNIVYNLMTQAYHPADHFTDVYLPVKCLTAEI